MKINIEGNFREYGYILIRDFYDSTLIGDAYNDIKMSQKKIAGTLEHLASLKVYDQSNYGIENNGIKYLKRPEFWFTGLDFLVSNDLFNLITSLIGAPYYLSGIELHQKLPGMSGTPPHQDNFYFGLELKKNIAVTAYISLNSQNEKMGGLGFYPGSHIYEFDHMRSQVVGFSSGINPKKLIDFELLTPEMNPGDLIIHHCNIVHEALENRHFETRSNIAIRFFPNNPIFNLELKNKYNEFKAESKRIS